MADDVLRLVPPGMARMLRKHRPEILAAASREPAADLDLALALSDAIDGLRRRAPQRVVVPKIALILNAGLDLDDPYAAFPAARTKRGSSCPGARFEATRPGYERYADGIARRAPLVFYGWSYDLAARLSPGTGPSSPAVRGGGLGGIPGAAPVFTQVVLDWTAGIRGRVAEDAEDLCRAYFPDGPSSDAVSSLSFDDRSIPFAIASLSRSHAVSDAANLLLAVWAGSGGDLEGTPYWKPPATRAGEKDGIH
jgi:hypothetical protein